MDKPLNQLDYSDCKDDMDIRLKQVAELSKRVAAQQELLERAEEVVKLCIDTLPDHYYQNETDGWGCTCKSCKLMVKAQVLLRDLEKGKEEE